MGADRDAFGLRGGKGLRHDLRIAGMKAAGDIDARDDIEHGGIVADPVGAKTFAAIAIQIDAAHDLAPLWRRKLPECLAGFALPVCGSATNSSRR